MRPERGFADLQRPGLPYAAALHPSRQPPAASPAGWPAYICRCHQHCTPGSWPTPAPPKQRSARRKSLENRTSSWWRLSACFASGGVFSRKQAVIVRHKGFIWYSSLYHPLCGPSSGNKVGSKQKRWSGTLRGGVLFDAEMPHHRTTSFFPRRTLPSGPPWASLGRTGVFRISDCDIETLTPNPDL